MRYTDNIKIFCGIDWRDTTVTREERNGGYSVAIMMSFLSGVPPTLKAIGEHLGESRESLQFAYDNLMKSGMFSKSFDAKSDFELLGTGLSATAKVVSFDAHEENMDFQVWSVKKAVKNAWGHIAAIGSGIIDRNIEKQRK